MTQRHPSAEKWAKWPAPPDVEMHATEAYRKHVRDWHERRGERKLPVYRPTLDGSMTATIADARKVFREMLVYVDDVGCLLIYALQRIKALEERKMPEYKGVWKQDQDYDDNSLVTHDGSMFIARAQSRGIRPGDGALWTLCVKRGRDARAVVARKDLR